MNNNNTCQHGGVSPISLLDDLHENQGKSSRHRCPTCAFEQGFNLGGSGNWRSYEDYCSSLTDKETCKEGSIASTNILINLGDSQSGIGRHKCTNCAFKQGFEAGVLQNGNQEIAIEEKDAPNLTKNKGEAVKKTCKIDFIEKEIRNKHLGLLGERFILKNEINILKDNDREDLANKVKHVSLEDDGLGYDILSYGPDGKEKKIEVKTTRSDISRPFYLTQNELKVSSENPENYFLYRLFDFDSNLNKGKYYIIQGDLEKSLQLESRVFIAFPKPNS